MTPYDKENILSVSLIFLAIFSIPILAGFYFLVGRNGIILLIAVGGYAGAWFVAWSNMNRVLESDELKVYPCHRGSTSCQLCGGDLYPEKIATFNIEEHPHFKNKEGREYCLCKNHDIKAIRFSFG